MSRVLLLSPPAWDRVAEEIQAVLERAMREEIREKSLADERRKVSARISLDVPDEDAIIVAEVVQALIAPNAFINTQKTEERRQEARARVEPVTATLARNEIILRSGDIADPLDIEALDALELRQSDWDPRHVRGPRHSSSCSGLCTWFTSGNSSLPSGSNRCSPF